MSSRNREQVVNECATAAAGCWNHYSDNRLSQEAVDRIAEVLSTELPESISTTEWQKYADDYQKRMENEEDDDQEPVGDQTERAHEAYSQYGKVSVCGQTWVKDGKIDKDGKQAISVYFEKMNEGVALKDVPTEFEGVYVLVRLTGKIEPL